MDIYESYKILGISSSSEIEDINRAFKKLAKEFHPDANPDKLDWAHKKMSALNMAYQIVIDFKKNKGSYSGKSGPTISDFLKNLFKKDGFYSDTHPHSKTKSGKDYSGQTKNESESYYEKHPSYEELKRAAEKRQNIISQVSKAFKRKKDIVDEAMFIYYQYKLFKRGLRSEGVGRLKFGDVRRNLKKGLNEIEKIRYGCTLDDLAEELDLYISFVTKFKESMNCKDYLASYKNIDNVEAFRFYRKGSEKLDNAFSYIFFETKAQNRLFNRVNITNLLSMAMENFIFIGEQYASTPFAFDANVKADLLDFFYRLYIKNYFK